MDEKERLQIDRDGEWREFESPAEVRLRSRGPDWLVLPDVGSVADEAKEPGVEEPAEHGLALPRLQSPETTCLLGGKPKPWHFEELGAGAHDHLFERCVGLQ